MQTNDVNKFSFNDLFKAIPLSVSIINCSAINVTSFFGIRKNSCSKYDSVNLSDNSSLISFSDILK